MNFMIHADNINNHKRKGIMMTINNRDMNESAELLKLRREKRKERRRRQLDAFYESMNAQNADKVIFLFDNDLNIA